MPPKTVLVHHLTVAILVADVEQFIPGAFEQNLKVIVPQVCNWRLEIKTQGLGHSCDLTPDPDIARFPDGDEPTVSQCRLSCRHDQVEVDLTTGSQAVALRTGSVWRVE